MRTRRKILMGVATVALPATSFLVFGGPTIFAGASSSPAFPVACKITASVTFTPPLTMTGTITTSKSAVTTMTITGGHWTGCLSAASSTAPGHGIPLDQTISLPATKLGSKRYATGYCPLFNATNSAKTLRAFKGLTFNVTWTGGAGGASVFTTSKTATMTNIDGELGLVFSTKQAAGSYTERALNQITEFFDATDSAALLTGCASSQTVTTATIDVANSVGIL
jgi:hypothetical protein